MPKRIYVGNLPFSASNNEVRNLFEKHGSVESVNIKANEGIGFVVMGSGGGKAIQALNKFPMGGKNLIVKEASS